MKNFLKVSSRLCVLSLISFGAFSCSCSKKHTHDFSTQWSTNEEFHWHECNGENCNEVDQKNSHVSSDWIVDATPTCEEDGSKHKECTVCHKVLETLVIDSEGHEYGTPSYTWSDDKSTCTGSVVCETDSTHVITETCDVIAEVTQDFSCEQDELTTYRAIFCDGHFDDQVLEDVVTQVASHDYGEPQYQWSSDYKTCTAKVVCSRDATHVVNETVNSTKNIISRTCTQDGLIRYNAVFTNALFSEQVLELDGDPASGHSYYYTYKWSSDFLKCTKTGTCSNNSNHMTNETVDAVVTNYGEPTCMYNGSLLCTATFKGNDVQTRTINDETRPAFGHSFADNGICSTCGRGLFRSKVHGTTYSEFGSVSAVLDAITDKSQTVTIELGSAYVKHKSIVIPSGYNLVFRMGYNFMFGTEGLYSSPTGEKVGIYIASGSNVTFNRAYIGNNTQMYNYDGITTFIENHGNVSLVNSDIHQVSGYSGSERILIDHRGGSLTLDSDTKLTTDKVALRVVYEGTSISTNINCNKFQGKLAYGATDEGATNSNWKSSCSVSISGGAFDYFNIIDAGNTSLATDRNIVITGGTYYIDVSSYVPNTHKVVYDESTGLYSVEENVKIVF